MTLQKVLAFVVALLSISHCQKLDNVTCEEYDCTECYNLLVHTLLKSDGNQYNMTRAFFPPDDATPVSVIIYYDFRDDEKISNESAQKIWFWTSSNFYHFIPIGILQYFSLFFTDPSLRVSYLNITLDSDCANASDDYMQLLTQRLKLYTINFDILPTITEDYNSKATGDNADTIENWNKNKKVSRYILSYSVMLWFFSILVSIPAISFYLFANPHDYLNRVKKAIKDSATKNWEIKTQMFTMMALSTMFSIYAIGMDIAATIFKREKLIQEYNVWYKELDADFIRLNRCLFSLDLIGVVALIIMQGLVWCNGFCKRNGLDVALPFYFLVIPIAIVASRIDLIIIAFMQNAFHATGVAVTYCIIVLTCIAILEVSSHLFIHCFPEFMEPKDDKEDERKCKCGRNECAKFLKKFGCAIAFIALVTFILSVFVYLIAVYFLIPINIAFDEAPNELLTIYQSVVVLFAGLLAYWILIRLYRSPLDVLIQAKDSLVKERENNLQQPTEDLTSDWNKMSDALKEKEIAKTIFTIMERLHNSCPDNAIRVKMVDDN